MTTSFDKFNARLQAQLASLVAGAGLIWAAKVGTATRLGIRALVITPGLVELLGVTVLVWLVAKWRAIDRASSGVAAETIQTDDIMGG